MSTIDLASPDKKTIRHYFDQIAGRYDLINNLLSFKLDEKWRRKAVKLTLEGHEQSLLDLGVGTGKFLKEFLDAKSWSRAVGVDFSTQMLNAARQELPEQVELVSGDFHDLPFPSSSFDLIISSFTLRSVKDIPKFLEEVHRLLVPGGKAIFLCLTRPENFFFKLIYYPYLNFYLPLVGQLFSGHNKAYQFLSQSIQHFQSPTKTTQAMSDVGFVETRIHPFTFGSATLIYGRK